MFINVFPGLSRPAVIEVIAPPGVTFPPNCIEEATRSVQGCVRGVSPRTAILILTRVAIIESAAVRDVKLRVINPPNARGDARNQWLVRGNNTMDGTIVGW